MPLQPDSSLRQIARSELSRRAKGSLDSAALATAAAGAREDLAAVLVPLIGQAGVNGLTSRAAHLTRRGLPLPIAEGEEAAVFRSDHALSWLKRIDDSGVAEAAEVMLATLASLLVTFIGESLTMRLLRKAWPGGFSADVSEGQT